MASGNVSTNLTLSISGSKVSNFDKIENILGFVIITFSKSDPGIAPGFLNVILEVKFVYFNTNNRFELNETGQYNGNDAAPKFL